MKYFCKRKCFYRARLWTPGETLESMVGEKVPDHFATEKPEAKIEVKEPIALSEMTSREAVEISPSKPMALSQYGKSKKR